MTVGETAEPTPVAHDFAAMVTNFHQMVKHLADGGTDAFDAGQSIGFMQDVERFRNQLSVVDHLMIAAAERLDLPTLLCQGSMRRVLMSALGLSKGEAARRVRAAEAVGPRTSMLGDVLTSWLAAGPAGSTQTASPNGPRPNGSTETRSP